MRRSLYFALLGRLLAGFAVVAVLWYGLPRMWVDAVAGVIVALGLAWWCAQVVRRTLVPLEQAVRDLGAGKELAERKLAESADGRRELEALLKPIAGVKLPASPGNGFPGRTGVGRASGALSSFNSTTCPGETQTWKAVLTWAASSA